MSDRASNRRRKRPTQPEPVETSLLAWGPRGSVRAEVDGKTALVDRGIPGERVVAQVRRGRDPWRGVVEAVLSPSSSRVEAPCPYYHLGCGGCQWQHLAYGSQLETKQALVDRELEQTGCRFRVSRVHPMNYPWRYRRTAAIALGWEAGFRPQGRRGIVEIHDCLISHPLIGCLADSLNRLLRTDKLPHYRGKVWLDCTVVGSERNPSLQVLIQGIEGLTLETHPELPDVAGAVASLEGVSGVAFRHRSGEPRPLVGPLCAEIEVAGHSFQLPAGSFFQTNLEMLGLVLRTMRDAVAKRRPKEAADIYGGVGTFGLSLANEVEHMTLIELDRLAVEAARRTSAAWGLRNVTFITGHAERALDEVGEIDLAIVDPPRSGLAEKVVEALCHCKSPLLLYLSCAPPSLARDLQCLEAAGYRARSLEIFDFYPQTHHVETLAVLER